MSLLHFQFYTRGDSKAKSKHSRKISLNLDCVEWMGLSETCSVLRDLSSLHVGGWNRSLPKCINEAYDFMYAMKKKIFWFAHSMRFFEKKIVKVCCVVADHCKAMLFFQHLFIFCSNISMLIQHGLCVKVTDEWIVRVVCFWFGFCFKGNIKNS